jgi:hypothetical protein
MASKSESRYIKLDYIESINAKKQILESEIGLIGVARAMNNYKLLRKKESETRVKIKACLYNLKSEISSIQSTFPEQEKVRLKNREKQIKISKKEDLEITENSLNFQKDLDEIKRKLARLE